MMPLFAILMPVIILFCGLSLDVGLMELKKLQMQSAADAAARGAELELERGTGLWGSAARKDAGLNGFVDGDRTVEVAVLASPLTGPYAGMVNAVQVTITQQVETIFMGSLHAGLSTVRATATALVPPCVYVTSPLGPAQSQRSEINPSNVTRCPSTIGPNDLLDGTSRPQATQDPLRATRSPVFPGYCNHINYELSSGTAVLFPGTYCRGLTLSNSAVTLSPGLYVITGGAHWSNSVVKGAGVTLFFTQGGGAGFGSFVVDRNSALTLSAPVDDAQGGIPAVLIFADRGWVRTSASDFSVQNSTVHGDGIWYTPGAGLSFANAGTVRGDRYLGIVADRLSLAGTLLDSSGDFSAVAGGNPFRPAGGLVQ